MYEPAKANSEKCRFLVFIVFYNTNQQILIYYYYYYYYYRYYYCLCHPWKTIRNV